MTVVAKVAEAHEPQQDFRYFLAEGAERQIPPFEPTACAEQWGHRIRKASSARSLPPGVAALGHAFMSSADTIREGRCAWG
jgi:hypothetical protein